MGTNYYTKNEKCPTCGNEPEGLHLGKSSIGWKFIFQYNGGTYYETVEGMKSWLKDKKIVDEYGAEVSYEDFWKMVDTKQKPEFKSHAEEHPSQYDFVLAGYSFTDREFS